MTPEDRTVIDILGRGGAGFVARLARAVLEQEREIASLRERVAKLEPPDVSTDELVGG